MAMSPRAPVTEVRDHDLLINLVDGMIRGLNKASDTLRVKATKVEGEIKALAHNKSVEPEEGLSEAAKVDFANVEALTKKAIAEAEIGRASQQEAKEKEFKHINDQLKKIEDRRQTLFRWIRYMRTLDAEATAMRENEATYIQQRQEQLAREAAYFEKEIVDSRSLTKEDFTQIATECQKIIVFLETEKNYCIEIMDAIKGTQENFKEIHKISKELATLDNRDELYKQIIEEARKELEATPPGSPMAKLLERRIERTLQEIEDNRMIREFADSIATTTSTDSPESIELERQLQQQTRDYNAICREIEFTKEIEKRATQAAKMAPSSLDDEAELCSSEARDMGEEFHGVADELQRSHGMPAASLGSTIAADQTSKRAEAAAQHKLRHLNAASLKEEISLIFRKLKEISKREDSLYLDYQQLNPKDPNYHEKRLQIETQLEQLKSERGYLTHRVGIIKRDFSQLSKPRGNTLPQSKSDQEQGWFHDKSADVSAIPAAPRDPIDKPTSPKPKTP